MARYVSLIQFTEQGIRNIKDTIKRGDTAMAEAEAALRQWLAADAAAGQRLADWAAP